MKVMTFQQYQEEACEGGIPDAGYWNRVVDCLHRGIEPEDWDEEGQPLYGVADLLKAERTAKELLDS